MNERLPGVRNNGKFVASVTVSKVQDVCQMCRGLLDVSNVLKRAESAWDLLDDWHTKYAGRLRASSNAYQACVALRRFKLL